MKFANIGGRAACVAEGNRTLDLNQASNGNLPADPMEYVTSTWRPHVQLLVDQTPISAFRETALHEFKAPVPRPENVLAVALNYRGHATESERDVPQEPAVFGKLISSLCGPFDPIEVPDTCSMVDYEAEVVVVVGRRMRGVKASEVWDHIGGITAGQDISDRAEQRRPPLGQFSLAKSYDTFSPVGPVMATLDEFADLNQITVSGSISGEEVQRGRTSQLIYSIPELMAWICRYITLKPGDLVFTGTPEGVGARRVPPLYLTEGMVLGTEIPEVGHMRNPIRSVSAQINEDLYPTMEVTS